MEKLSQGLGKQIRSSKKIIPEPETLAPSPVKNIVTNLHTYFSSFESLYIFSLSLLNSLSSLKEKGISLEEGPKNIKTKLINIYEQF